MTCWAQAARPLALNAHVSAPQGQPPCFSETRHTSPVDSSNADSAAGLPSERSCGPISVRDARIRAKTGSASRPIPGRPATQLVASSCLASPGFAATSRDNHVRQASEQIPGRLSIAGLRVVGFRLTWRWWLSCHVAPPPQREAEGGISVPCPRPPFHCRNRCCGRPRQKGRLRLCNGGTKSAGVSWQVTSSKKVTRTVSGWGRMGRPRLGWAGVLWWEGLGGQGWC